MSRKLSIDFEEIRKLAELVAETELSQIEIEEDDMRICVSRDSAAQVVQTVAAPVATAPAPAAAAPAAAPAAAAPAPAADAAGGFDSHPGAIKSPMVGTVYLQPEPSAPKFVKVGDTVSAGDTLMIIEAMKVMNPIKAAASGTVTQILVNDNEPVEFDEVLAVIE